MARLVLFDIDMTLIRTHGAGRAAISTAFERTFGVPNATGGMAIDGRTDRAIFLEVLAFHGLSADDCTYGRARDAYLEDLGPSIAARDGLVLPGVDELLSALQASHGMVGLATGNMERGAAIKLGHFGLWERFAAGGFGDDTSVRAEVVRAGIEALAAKLGVDPNPADTIVIGDTPLDVEAAHLAGARALAVATGSFPPPLLEASGAETVVADLADTEAILRVLRD